MGSNWRTFAAAAGLVGGIWSLLGKSQGSILDSSKTWLFAKLFKKAPDFSEAIFGLYYDSTIERVQHSLLLALFQSPPFQR